MNPHPSQPSEPFPREKIPPDILEGARQTFDEQDFLAQIREIELTGGVQLEDFIAELEARARSRKSKGARPLVCGFVSPRFSTEHSRPLFFPDGVQLGVASLDWSWTGLQVRCR